MTVKILCYHGVINEKEKSLDLLNYNHKHINTNDFDRQMCFLKRNENVIPLKNLKKIKKKKNYTIITFDDGFKNNYTIAYKILKKYRLPATFFICPGMINKNRLFWVDEIEMCFQYTKKKKFKILINNKQKLFNISTLKKRIKVCEKIKIICKKSKNLDKDLIINKLKKSLKITKLKKINYLHNTLSWADVKKMNSDKLIDFGIHSYKHEIYSRLSNDDQEKNILKSKRMFCQAGIKSNLASYPEGRLIDFNKKTIELMIKNKIDICLTARAGSNYYKKNYFYLKRYMVGLHNLKFPYKNYYEN